MRHLALIVFFLFLLPGAAQAQQAGEPCQKFGQTIVSDDKKSVLACLRPRLGDPSSPLVWMLNTAAPKAWMPNGDTGPEPFYTIGPEHKIGE
jgi:hypothetical protein